MNRFLTSTKQTPLLRRIFFSVFFTGCGIVFLLLGCFRIAQNKEDSYVKSLQTALQRSAVHCYAMEGQYPESLDYLKEHYAVHWDPAHYVVDYEIIGTNRMPIITVIPLHP